MFCLHRDEETKTALSIPTPTILLQCGDRKSVMILLLRWTWKKQPKMLENRNETKRKKKLRSRWIPKGNKNKMDFHAQRNSQDECKGQMQRWSSFLCWDSVFVCSISWRSQSGDNPQERLAKNGYNLNVKVKCVKIVLYLWLDSLVFLKFWSNYGDWESIKALYCSRFNFLYSVSAIYSQPKKRLAGTWERNSLLRTEVGTFAAISTNGDRLPTDTMRTEMREAPSARTNEEGVRTCWPVLAGYWRTIRVSARGGSGYYTRWLPVPYPRHTQPRTYLAWYSNFDTL